MKTNRFELKDFRLNEILSMLTTYNGPSLSEELNRVWTRRRSQRKQLTHHLNKEKIMLKAKSSEIIQSALFDINNQYDNQIDDIDTSLLVESALLIAFESHKSEQKEVLQNLAHSVCNYALTIERAKIESDEISALMFAYDDTEETAEESEETVDKPVAETVPAEQTTAFDPEALKKIAGTSMTVEDNGDIRLSFKHQ